MWNSGTEVCRRGFHRKKGVCRTNRTSLHSHFYVKFLRSSEFYSLTHSFSHSWVYRLHSRALDTLMVTFWKGMFLRVFENCWLTYTLSSLDFFPLLFLHQSLPMYNIHICLLRHRKELIQQQQKKSTKTESFNLTFVFSREMLSLVKSNWFFSLHISFNL